jgi:adenine phosphoribosyltransferase
MTSEDLRRRVRDVPDFPEPGVLFRDITPLLGEPDALRSAVRLLADPFRERSVDLVVGIESRGFIFGPPVALELGAGFQIARKLGKLPWKTHGERYQLEYGTAQLEIHQDAVRPGQRVLVIDDVIATGGTAAAATRLLQRVGGVVVAAAFLIELDALAGRRALGDVPVFSLIHY